MNSRYDETRRDPPAAVSRRSGVVVESVGQVVVLYACGEVDAYTLAHWRNLLDSAEVDAGGHLVIELGEITFLSVRAVVVLAELAQRLSRDGITVHLANSRFTSAIERILEVADLTGCLAIHRDLAAAIAATEDETEA